VAVDNIRAFDETLYILMCGTGVGFSVERQYVNKLPDLPEEIHYTDTVIKVADSKIGWAKAYKELMSLLYAGQIPHLDVSNVRPQGARLKTFGGRASGPAPLDDLFTFTSNIFFDAVTKGQKKLVSIDCHDLMCKIAEVVVRPNDTWKDLERKVELATILGTFQATLTNFRYLTKAWKDNTEEEALLGVSLTGIMDNTKLIKGDNLPKRLEVLKNRAVAMNEGWSDMLGIKQSVAVTCVKPSGTVSQLVDSASGIHTRHSEYYLRTVRADKKDPIAQLMVDQGVYHEDDITKPEHTLVFYFPIKSPDKSLTRIDLSAIEHLEIWKMYQDHWCEHKPSATISVRESEWLKVGAWVWDNFDRISGVSFLPYADHSYQQAPYQEITEDEYKEWMNKTVHEINWDLITEYEKEDMTENTKELACTAGACEII